MDSFEFDTMKIYVAPDFAIRNHRGNAILMDWKTGRVGDQGDILQIVCYGLYAKAKWGMDPARAIGELHYLLAGDTRQVSLDQETLDEGQNQMRGSIQAMKELLWDPVENHGREEDFPRTENVGMCRRCNFRRVCRPELAAPPE